MKKITFLIAFLTVTMGFSQELITNGGFEDGALSDWSTFSYGSAVVTSHESMTPHSGSYFATRGLYSAALIQEFVVTPGTSYTVNFYYGYNSAGTYSNPGFFKIRNRTGDANGAFMDLTPVVADNGANSSNAQNYGASWQAPHYTWNQGSFTFVAATGMTLARFQWWNDSNAMAYLDDVSIVETPTASLADLKKFNFNVSPNPAKDHLSISAAKPINKIEVYNLLGQQVINSNLNGTRQDISVSNLSKGVYILKAFIEDATGTYKFVKE